MALKYEVIPVTGFQQNCSIIWCDKTNEAAIVDPGGDVSLLLAKVKELGVEVKRVLLTHGHLDHVGGTMAISSTFNVPVWGPEKEDEFWLQALPSQSQMFGFEHTDAFTPDRWFEDGDEVTVGESVLTVIHAPGHTPGHIVFVSLEDRLAWVGDVLFYGSIGRTDFPKGDHATLISSIRDKLLPLGDDIAFIPGHGPQSTFGNEREFNPYVADGLPTP
ncbi:hypothetical protein CS022_03855 [Veronia nyctiphanis]|uniref:Metallo-beta-lactamase domain-containing protein n=1 Tax=Veronia nyctiphanis TaxID=1278244 RepID=A0A4Q0YVG5_9GAMM|nr:MBL fold metallo-hydrolase [Veronia nyctiphanis]RXJ74214.1 hypothetical protein CS022_03855 [Veronia nyctiphanis]